MAVHHGRHRFHARQHLEARLRLPGFRGLGAEAIHEGLQVAAMLFLLLHQLHLQRLLLAALALETRVIAAPEGQLGLIEMQDMVGHLIQQIAVMADDQHGRGIMGEIVDQPERAFEIEIVGGLVEQQNVRRRKEHGGEGHAHAPAA